MNFVIKYIRCLWLAVFLCIATASCDSDADIPVLTSEGRLLNIGFKMPARNGTVTEAGVDRENYIDWSDNAYRIYFFDTNNKFIASFTPENGIRTKVGSNENAIGYEAVGKIPEELIETDMQGSRLIDFKIVVLANWDNYPEVSPGVTTIDVICNAEDAKFDCLTQTDLQGGKWKIPFYGVQEYEGGELTAKTTTLTPSVALLRAMAKVEVSLDPTIPDDTDSGSHGAWSDFSITGISIRRYNKTGYCAPTGVYKREDYPDDPTTAPALHLVDGSNSNEDKSLNFFYQESENKWIAYVPEYSNRKDTDVKSFIEMKLNFQLDEDEPYKLYFADYSGGTTPTSSGIDLIRNNIYRFTVSKKGYGMQLYVSDWEGYYENNFEYGDGQFTTPVAPWEDEIGNPVEY